MDTCYYSFIRRLPDGSFVGWVPDLPGVRASGITEDAVVRLLSRDARDFLHDLVIKGMPLPVPGTGGETVRGEGAPERRLLLILS